MEAEKQEKNFELLPFWKSLNADQREMVRRHHSLKKLKSGLILKGGEGDIEGLIMVVEGQIRAFMNTKGGKELTLYRLLDRDICVFSSSCMVKGNSMDIYIEAEKDTEVLLIPSVNYRNLLDNAIEVSDFTNRLISERFSQVMGIMEQALFTSFEKRLALFLMEQSNIEETDILSITHETIARHLGTAREVVTRKLKDFAREDILEISRGTIEIKDREKLRSIS